jgi:hypothetical protein
MAVAKKTQEETLPLVEYSNFVKENLNYTSPQKKEATEKEKGGKIINYFLIPLNYRYPITSPNGETKIKTDGFFFQYCKVRIAIFKEEKQEFVIKNDNNGTVDKKEYTKTTMMVVFPLENKETREFLDIFNTKVYRRMAEIVEEKKDDIQQYDFEASRASSCKFKNPIYYPMDKGKVIEGKDPTQWLKVPYSAVFCDLKGNPIDRSILKNANCDCILCVQYLNIGIYGIGIKAIPTVRSGIITKIIPKGSQIRQSETLKKLQQENPELQTQLEQQIEAMMSGKTTESSTSSGKMHSLDTPKEVSNPEEGIDLDVDPISFMNQV